MSLLERMDVQLIDEAHHLLPADWQPAPQIMTKA